MSYFNIVERYRERIKSSKERLSLAWRGENKDRPAFVIHDVNAALFGYDDAPDEYFEYKSMFEYQAAKIERHMAEIPDNYIPVFHPWYSTAVLPSALGVKVRFFKGMDPAAEGGVIEEPGDINKLETPDPYTQGLMPKVLSAIDYFRKNTDAAVAVTDTQGPLNIALTLTGIEKLFIWMFEYPHAVHELMDFCTDALIQWIKVQKNHAGHKLHGDSYPHTLYLPSGYGGVSFSDDDLVVISPSQYREFVMPYNEKLLAAFGGGTVHFCGSAEHQLENLANMIGCTGVNNFMMGNLRQAYSLLKLFRGKGAIMACDYNAVDIQGQCNSLKRMLSGDPSGCVAGLFITPKTALSDDGTYIEYEGSRDELVSIYAKQFDSWLEK